MARRSYGQICGVSRALEIVGERWALLIVRDLIAGPKRFTDLRQGLPRIPTNVLSARLKELEQAKVLQRRILPRPATAVVYELTEYGSELEDILMALGRWGVKSMGQPEPGDIYTASSLMMAMRAGFHPDDDSPPAPVNYELRITDVVLSVSVRDGELGLSDGPQPDPDLVIETEHALAPLLMGWMSATEAISSGSIRVVAGDPALLTEFADTFRW
ncbi:winged helix-turn-helix transcriptional regulator [Jatrophihabitans sp.]|uniref:winged helix-turn-helix transcriptional regulator n=1 Tax=Jatrophihabitans sp. TaxID=1932789 RepID=UPI002D04DD40|nr:helix-turn-helix domain-containing protein [Jatrophihabitans sp.]